MKSILYIATSDIHLKTFHVPYLDWLTRSGHSVDLAYDDRGGNRFEMARQEYQIGFPRSLEPFALCKAFSGLKRVIDQGDYDILHCHTPIPSALTRLAGRWFRKRGGKLLYTAHGFHFYKGGPLRNWLLYCPSELLLSHLTDFIVTINSEDLAHTKKPFWGAASAKIPGMGIQPRGFAVAGAEEKLSLRRELGFDTQDFILLYVAEFIPRKNHCFLIKCAAKLRNSIPELKVVLLGRGITFDECKTKVKRLGLEDAVIFKGFRKDVAKFAQIADVGISASKHEGLGIALLEQMLCGVPVVASYDRGHREFVENGKTGFMFQQKDHREFSAHVKKLYLDRKLLAQMGERACARAKKFQLESSLEAMAKIYERFL